MAAANHHRLVDELGIREGMSISIFNAPNSFELGLGELPDDVEVHKYASDAPGDLS